jgi:hypothetical protein
MAFQGRFCPGCHEEVPKDAVLCVKCGYHLQTGEKLKTERLRRPGPRIERLWDGDIPLQVRTIVCIVIVALFVIIALAVILAGEWLGAVAVLVVGVSMTLLGLGTFTRTVLTWSQKDQPIIRLTRWFCFFPLEKKKVDPRRFDRLILENVGASGLGGIAIFLFLTCLCGVLPGLVYIMAFSSRYEVALRYEADEPVCIYRGWNQKRMREIAEAVESATGLRPG